MNILYFFEYAPNPNRGGASRVANSLVNHWKYSNLINNIYCAYVKRETDYVSYFKEDILIELNNKHSFELFLERNNISIILYQTGYSSDYLDFIASCNKKNIPIITTYHSMPGWELRFLKNNLFSKSFINLSNVDKIKRISFSIYKRYASKLIAKKNRYIYNKSTRYVLLSEAYIQLFKQVNNISDDNKLCSISNPLSYPINERVDYGKKEKQVLVVGRFSESEKRFLYVLKVWEILKKEHPENEWKLIFVGYGPDENKYKNYISKNKINDVIFTGKQEPLEYYKKASIFLMTSSFEGFSLTLIESLQFGTVPIVMDSFQSVHDIIIDDYNGFIVEDNNIFEMYKRLYFLINNYSKRVEMGNNAMTYIKKFSIPVIAQKWETIFKEVVYGIKN